MTALNVVSVATINGVVAAVLPANTSENSLLSNAAASSHLYKVNMIMASNVDGTNSVDVTVTYHTAAALGGTSYDLIHTVTVPAKTSLVLLDKQIYLGENTSLGVTLSNASRAMVLCSYEDMS